MWTNTIGVLSDVWMCQGRCTRYVHIVFMYKRRGEIQRCEADDNSNCFENRKIQRLPCPTRLSILLLWRAMHRSALAASRRATGRPNRASSRMWTSAHCYLCDSWKDSFTRHEKTRKNMMPPVLLNDQEEYFSCSSLSVCFYDRSVFKCTGPLISTSPYPQHPII